MNMKQNKILAAFLVAGIIAMISGFASHILYHPAHLEQNAFPIAVAEAAEPAAAGAAAAPATAEPIDALLATADAANGEKLAKVCAACHSFDNGGPNKVGPNLFGIVGANKAHKSDFNYSESLKAKGGTWTTADLNEFLWNPKKFVAGTKMTYAGMKKPEDRAALIKWLETKK